jgi:rhodanese-related sulfurtransferase
MNLVVALLLGIAFGFVLEQAGFSSSRKLTGLFYGTDFTVLRVFFTAGVTAMSGVLLFTQLGWLDADLIYINPTFLHSAILGGVIMGVGFVLGGYCPGTSFCGAAVGRVDAMAFIAGSLLGIFGFGEAFPVFEGIYKAGSKGDLLISTALGLSGGQFAGIMIAVAVAAFVVTTRLEKKVNPQSGAYAFPVAWHRAGAALLLGTAILLAAVPDRKARLTADAVDPNYLQRHPVRTLAADELAIHLLDRDPKLQLVDVRDTAAFARATLPGAVNVPAATLFGKEPRSVLADNGKLKVFFGANAGDTVKAAALARLNGYENVAALDGGYEGFMATVMNFNPTPATAFDLSAFRLRAKTEIAALMREQSAPKTPKVIKRVQGGCGG